MLKVLIEHKGGCVVCYESEGPKRTNIGNHIYRYGGLNDQLFKSYLIYDREVRVSCVGIIYDYSLVNAATHTNPD